jgi:hypothetical protein
MLPQGSLATGLNNFCRFSGHISGDSAGRKRGATFQTVLLAVALFISVSMPEAKAASPSSATLASTDSTPITWTGTATGPAAPALPSFAGVPELPSCEEGVNCDSFALTIDGTTADWTGKVARIRINWLLPTTDYDLYVVRDTPSHAYIITQSAYNPPGSFATHATADLTPSWYGTGQYRVLVVYRNATAADQYTGSASAVAISAANQCGVPGEMVLSDIWGDALDKQSAHDIYSIYIGEPYAAGPDRLVFTMEMANLNWLSPGTAWRVYFRVPHVAGPQYFVDMRTDTGGAVSYKYGMNGMTLGDADAGSYDPQSSSITITISNNKIGSPTPNQYPAQKLDQIYMYVSVGGLIVDSAPSRDVVLSQASYTVVGNDACQ